MKVRSPQHDAQKPPWPRARPDPPGWVEDLAADEVEVKRLQRLGCPIPTGQLEHGIRSPQPDLRGTGEQSPIQLSKVHLRCC